MDGAPSSLLCPKTFFIFWADEKKKSIFTITPLSTVFMKLWGVVFVFLTKPLRHPAEQKSETTF